MLWWPQCILWLDLIICALCKFRAKLFEQKKKELEKKLIKGEECI
jgi:hypothetical protein